MSEAAYAGTNTLKVQWKVHIGTGDRTYPKNPTTTKTSKEKVDFERLWKQRQSNRHIRPFEMEKKMPED